MNGLIKINMDSSDRPTVSGRELHEALGIQTPYRVWFPRMCEYGFAENADYTPYIFVHPQNKQSITDHQLTIDMAKEICMIQRSEKGKACRRYFLEVEKNWNSPEAVMSRALKIADRKLIEAQNHVLALETKIEQDKPKVLFADSVSASSTSILVGELAKLLGQNGVETGQKRLFAWLREHGYLIKRQGSDYNMPTQKSMEMGLFEVKENVIIHSDGHSSVTKTPKVTGKGQVYFINKFLS